MSNAFSGDSAMQTRQTLSCRLENASHFLVGRRASYICIKPLKALQASLQLLESSCSCMTRLIDHNKH